LLMMCDMCAGAQPGGRGTQVVRLKRPGAQGAGPLCSQKRGQRGAGGLLPRPLRGLARQPTWPGDQPL